MIRTLSFALFIFILLISIILIIFQEHFIYTGYHRTIIPLKPPYQHLKNNSYYKQGTSDELWLIFGGNGSLPQDYVILTKNTNHSYIYINYPGFGGIDGSMSPNSSLKLIDDIITLIPNKYTNINILGYSIGCAVSMHYLYKRPKFMKKINKIRLLAPFWSLDEVANNRYLPYLPNYIIKTLLSHNWENYIYIKHIDPNINLIILHGQNDIYVPYDQSKRLHELRPNTMFITTDDDHESILKKINIVLNEY